jgi:hypothetical protein
MLVLVLKQLNYDDFQRSHMAIDVGNFVYGFPVFQFLWNQHHIERWTNFEKRVHCRIGSDITQDVSFRTNVKWYCSSIFSVSLKIIQTVDTGDRYVEIICISSHKITSLETTQSYSRAKVQESDCVATVRFYNWLRETVCNGVIDFLITYFTDKTRF